MALIKCPNCQKEISDSAGFCIHCKASVTVCSECKETVAGDVSSCPTCGYVFEKTLYNDISNTKTNADCQNVKTTSIPKNSQTESKDLYTCITEYMVYSDEYKLYEKILKVLYTIFVAIPFVFILPIFELAYTFLVRLTGSMKLASESLNLIYELDLNIFEILGNLLEIFPIDNFTLDTFLLILSFLICMAINGFLCCSIYDLIKKAMLESKIKSLEYNYANTVKKMYNLYNHYKNSSELESSDFELYDCVESYIIKQSDRTEFVTVIFRTILTALRTIIPFVYALCFSITFNIIAGTDTIIGGIFVNEDIDSVMQKSGIISVIICVLFIATISFVFSLIRKNKAKRVDAFFEKCKKDGYIQNKG